jgi:hypothetical protein
LVSTLAAVLLGNGAWFLRTARSGEGVAKGWLNIGGMHGNSLFYFGCCREDCLYAEIGGVFHYGSSRFLAVR